VKNGNDPLNPPSGEQEQTVVRSMRLPAGFTPNFILAAAIDAAGNIQFDQLLEMPGEYVLRPARLALIAQAILGGLAYLLSLGERQPIQEANRGASPCENATPKGSC
jgi:hypothetical protein